MRKNKFLTFALAAILIGSASFISCVSDTESESVQNIRNSRAELMRAEAALAVAQAEVARTLAAAEAALMAAQARQAEAEVALIAAQARQAEAEAELLEARAAFENAQTEIARERAAAELARLQIENEQAEIELERAKVNLERDRILVEQTILNAEITMERARLQAEVDMRNLQNQLDQMDINCEVLEEAIRQYQAFIGQVNDLTHTLASRNLDLMRAEALKADNLASNELTAARLIAEYNRWIENAERNIAQAEIRIENWTRLKESAGADVLEEIADLNRKIDALRIGAYNDARRNRDVAATVRNEARDAVLEFRSHNIWWYSTVRFTSWTNGGLGGFNSLPYAHYLTVDEIQIQLLPLQGLLDAAIEQLEELQAEFGAASDSLLIFHTAWQTATAARVAAQDARDLAQVRFNNDPTADNQTALDNAQTALNNAITAEDNAQNRFNTANSIVQNHPFWIDIAKNNVALREQQMEGLQEVLDRLTNYDPAVLEAAFIDAHQAWLDADDAYWDVRNEIDALLTMISDIRWLWYRGEWWSNSIDVNDIEDRIFIEENIIRQQTENIADFNRWINAVTVDVDIARAQLANEIARKQADIVAYEAKLAAAQAQAAAAKAVMNQRMP